MVTRTTKISLLAMALIILASSVAWSLNHRAINAPDSPQPVNNLSALSFINYSGDQVILDNLLGTPLIINAWASWCPFCVNELPDFAAAQKELGHNVKIIAVNRTESAQLAQEFSDRLGVTNDLIILLDKTDSFYKAIGGFSMPETIFVNAAGQIMDHKRGPMKKDEIIKRAQAIL